MVDKTLILRKLSTLDEYLKQISEYANISSKNYAADWKIQRIVERTLQMMIETCLDVSGHIISNEKLRVPETCADMFRILVENDILKGSQLEAFEKMAKFRNIIVHDYEKIDARIVLGILQKNLDDFEGFKILRSKVDMPIIADEGVFRACDIPKYVGIVDGINIKLSKSGGIREAFKMINVARAHKMKVMIGCMVETSVGISAAAQISSLVDYADLDGNVLISDDPYVGVTVENGYLKIPDGPGLGVVER